MSLVYEPEMKEEIILPWEAVKAAITKEDYKRDARWFLEFGGFVDPKKIHHKPGPDFAAKQTSDEVEAGMRRMIEAFRRDPTLAKKMAISFIRKYNERIVAKEIGTTEVRHRLKPVVLACEMNEILVPWKKLMRLVEHGRTTKEDREYKLEEIQALLPRAWIQLQVAILFMCSSGIRVGAFESLRAGDIRPVYKLGNQILVPDPKDLRFVDGLYVLPAGAEPLCGVITVYSEDTGEDYDTLISKEAYSKWNEYVKVRQAAGERVARESPTIVTRRLHRKEFHKWKIKGIANAINDLLWRSGLRTEKKRRHEVQTAHGFRKFFDNVAKDYIDEAYVEKLIGHHTGTKEHYDRHLPKPAIEQYIRAMPHLSITPAYRAEAELAKKLDEMKKIEDKGFTELRLQLLEKDSAVRKLEKRVEEQDVTLKEVRQVLVKIQRERERELQERSRQAQK